MHCLPQRLKSTFFRVDGKRTWSEIFFFQKTLILVFEVIVQAPKHTFEIGIFFFHVLAHCAFSFFGLTLYNLEFDKNSNKK